MILYSELFNLFTNWLDPNDVHSWSKIKFGRELPSQHTKGRFMSDGAQYYFGNISLTPGDYPGTQYIVYDNKLVLETGE